MTEQDIQVAILQIEARELSRVNTNKLAEELGKVSDTVFPLFQNLLKDPDPIIREGGAFGCRELVARGILRNEIREFLTPIAECEPTETVWWAMMDVLEYCEPTALDIT